MLLLLEIALTVSAWKAGWGARALIPAAVALAFGMLLGAATGATEGALAGGQAVGLFLFLDFLLIGALAVMSRTAPSAGRNRDGAPDGSPAQLAEAHSEGGGQ